MVVQTAKYPWQLVGPWYRKYSLGGGKGFSGKPIIQKYASSDFINDFLKDPQHSLKFMCEDFVSRTCSNIFDVVSPDTQGGDVMKLFLDGHSRFYLVICELHCQAPGFPKVAREQTCEAGFVVRRHKPRIDADIQDALQVMYAEKHVFQRKIAAKQEKINKIYLKQAKAGNSGILNQEIQQHTKAMQVLQDKSLQLDAKISASLRAGDSVNVIQGWKSTGNKGIGYWEPVDETPQVIEEEILPLYPLIAAENDSGHSSGHQTIWYGLIPTFSSDVDTSGAPRFSDLDMYDIRCFVRQHDPNCPRTPERNDCHGKLIWSEPTQSYRLASPYDLDGTSHTPINIRLPDTNALKEQSKRRPFGSASNVRMTMPANSNLGFNSQGLDTSKVQQRSNAIEQVCFFSIPLITIVALFVLNIFLPIVVFLLNLWFLLRLKFCIPPSIRFDGDIAATLKAHGPDFEASLKADASIDFNGFKNDMKTSIDDNFHLWGDMLNGDGHHSGLHAELDNNFDETAQLIMDMATDFSDKPYSPNMAGSLPTQDQSLVYFDTVSM